LKYGGITFNDLLSNIQKPLEIHHIRTILFSLPVNYLKDLRDFGLDKGGVDPFSPMYRLSSIICDVASFRRQRVLKVLFYVNILQCFFAVENFTANAVSVAIGDNGNRLIFEIWWNFFYDLFSIKKPEGGQREK
jgi:hypothetical protein